MSEAQGLIRDARALGVELDAARAAALCRLLDELAHWNRSFNLTAITERREMLTHHLLDSLSILPFLAGERVLDIGTGAGFPGLPLAIAAPQRRFVLLDSNGKKIRFVAHAVRTLGLRNCAAPTPPPKPMSPWSRKTRSAWACPIGNGRGWWRGPVHRYPNCCASPRVTAASARGCWP